MKPPYKLVFMGTPEPALPALQGLINSPGFDVLAVVTQPDRAVGRSKTPKPSPVKRLAQKNDILVLTPEKVKKNVELLDKLREMELDVMVVVVYGKILSQELLDIPKMGVVNVHPSLLPKHRGASPIIGSVLAGDRETGVTIMKLVFEMDAGPIIATSPPLPIDQSTTTATLTSDLAELGAAILLESLPRYMAGELTPTEQDHSIATFTGLINKKDGWIDWNEPAETIERKVRAYNPWPSAFTQFEDQPLKILSAEIVTDTKDKPGTVWQTDDNYPAITTVSGSLKLLQVHPAGKKPMSGEDFLKGNKNFVDSVLL